jgi:hypothetical protein
MLATNLLLETDLCAMNNDNDTCNDDDYTGNNTTMTMMTPAPTMQNLPLCLPVVRNAHAINLLT